MSTEVTLTAGSLAVGYCYPAAPQSLLNAFVAAMQASLPGTLNTFVFGSSTPGVDDQDKVWIKVDAANAFVGIYTYAYGSWVTPHDIPASSSLRMIWVGTEADLWAHDGGDGTNPSSVAPTATTGAMWQRDTDFDFRVPIGIGTNATAYGGVYTTIGVGGTGGEEKHALTDKEISHRHEILNKNVVAGATLASGSAYAQTDAGYSAYVGNTDGTKDAHENLPPYRGVIICKRTARIYRTA